MNKIIKILLVSTSLAPILLTYWFVEQVNIYNDSIDFIDNMKCNFLVGILYLIITVFLIIICLLIISEARKKLEILPTSIEEIKTVDNESLGFILVYLLPLANGVIDKFNIPILFFIAILFFFIVMTSNSYHFNPLLNFFGFHFYEVKVSGGINYILLSKKNITNSKSIKFTHHLTEYMILEKN